MASGLTLTLGASTLGASTLVSVAAVSSAVEDFLRKADNLFVFAATGAAGGLLDSFALGTCTLGACSLGACSLGASALNASALGASALGASFFGTPLGAAALGFGACLGSGVLVAAAAAFGGAETLVFFVLPREACLNFSSPPYLPPLE